MIANALGATGSKMIVAVDEADDLFAGVDEENAATRHGSKVFMNRLVERVAGPTIWIVNDIDPLGPAVVRRMNLVMRFPKPSLAVRKRMIARISDRAEFRLGADETAKLAGLPAAPALIENAIRSAARIGGSGREARQILECGLRAVGSREFAAVPTPLAFDPALSAADVDLANLAARAKTAPTRALSFCLSGPPGTGKSAYARHLAETLEMEALDKRYSDLISSYLGDSEKAIARAFEEAADIRAFLILDEADSFLRDRAAARYSWEITQVNEMLTQMERHPYPFACTTNAPDLLDPATARRFLFKVRFLPMTGEQIATAFRRAFGMGCPEFVVRLDNLTPGDFTLICRKAEAFGERDPVRLGRWLEEATAKSEGRRRIGF
jgi:SpoVK/Ycf46/Vps4 family AAA+-type ATPase